VSIVETLLLYGGIPLAVVLVVAGLVFGMGGRATPRYRPGRPFVFAPVWFLSARSGFSPVEPSSVPALPAVSSVPALPAAPSRPALAAGGSTSATVVAREQTGGARGSW